MNRITLAFAISVLLICIIALANFNTGLVAHWSFDDCTANDSIGDTNGTTNNTTCIQGKSNKALSFNGTDSFIDLGYRNDFVVHNQSTPITFSAWVMTNNSDKTDRMNVFSDNSCSGYYEFGLLSGKPSLLLRTTDWGGVALTASKSANLADNKFHHIVGSIDGQTVTLYSDGVRVAEQRFSVSKLYWCGQTHGYSGGSISGTGFKLNTTNAPEWGLFSGVIDDIRVYNRILADSEIKELYNSTQ